MPPPVLDSFVGTGLDDEHFSSAEMTVSPMALDLGHVTVGTMGGDMVLTVADIGGDPTGAISSVIMGADASSFAITGTTCASLVNAETCRVSIAFAPMRTGALAGYVEISASPGGAFGITLDGTGVQ